MNELDNNEPERIVLKQKQYWNLILMPRAKLQYKGSARWLNEMHSTRKWTVRIKISFPFK